MAPKTKNSGQTLKQGTLAFASAKRGAQTTAGGKANVLKLSVGPAAAKPPSAAEKARKERSSSTGSTISIISSSSSSSNDEDPIMMSTDSTASVQRAVKRLKTTSGSAKTVPKARQQQHIDLSSSDEDDEPQTPRTSLDVVSRTPGIHRLYKEAMARMGDMQPSALLLYEDDSQTDLVYSPC